MCDVVLDALVAAEFLEKTHHEAYVLAGGVGRQRSNVGMMIARAVYEVLSSE